MTTQRITDKLLRHIATPPKGRQTIVRDDLVRGFGARKTGTGAISFVFSYVAGGIDRRLTIGQYPAWSVAAAREVAKVHRRNVDIGEDPLLERHKSRAEATLNDLWKRYEEIVLTKKAASTQRNERSSWTRFVLPELGRRKLSAITPHDIEKLHQKISHDAPVQANRCLASVRHVFGTAIRWRELASNPATGITRNPEHGRERFLSEAERKKLVAVLGERPDSPAVLAIWMLLLTGARSGEVFKATWDQFDRVNGVWVKPSSHTKQRRSHRVPLSKAALDVLRRAEKFRVGAVVFPNHQGEPFTTLKKTFSQVKADAGLESFRMHDLRHSFASFLVADGFNLPIVGRLLGHTQVATTNRYSHLEDNVLRSATEQVGRRVAR